MKKLTVILFEDAFEYEKQANVISKIYTENCVVEAVKCKNYRLSF